MTSNIDFLILILSLCAMAAFLVVASAILIWVFNTLFNLKIASSLINIFAGIVLIIIFRISIKLHL